MPGIDPNFIKHELNVLPDERLVKIRNRARGCSDWRSGEIKRGECNNRSSLPELDVQHGCGKEEDRQMEGLCQFHKFQPSLPKRLLSVVEDWLIGGLYLESCPDEFLGCIPRLPTNSHAPAWPGEDYIHYLPRHILLQGYVIWSKKRWGHISEDDHENIWSNPG